MDILTAGLEWAPEAEAICLRGDFNDWKRLEYNYEKLDYGKWRISIPPNEDGTCKIPFDSKASFLCGSLCNDVLPISVLQKTNEQQRKLPS